MFIKQSKNRVLILIIWNLIIPIGVVILINPINPINLMPNYMLIMLYIIVLNYTPMLNLLNAKNWPYLVINYLNIFMSIIMFIKLSAI